MNAQDTPALFRMGRRERLIFLTELRLAFSRGRWPSCVSMTILGIFLVVQRSEVSPYIIVFIAALAALEEQFNNIFFRAPGELGALSLMPLSWDRVILTKNLAALVSLVCLSIPFAAAILYFAPGVPPASQLGNDVLHLLSIVFPLLHVGNLRSWQEPRRNRLRHTDAIVQLLGMLFYVVILSFPYVVFSILMDAHWLTACYCGGGMIYWLFRSVPRTAARVAKEVPRLCSL